MSKPDNTAVIEHIDAVASMLRAEIATVRSEVHQKQLEPIAIGVPEAAELLRVSTATVYEMIGKKCFGDVAKIGADYRISYRRIVQFIETGSTKSRRRTAA